MRNFYILWLGQVVSIFGSGLAGFGVGVWVFQRSGSATDFALTAFFAVLPSVLLGPISGVFIDRMKRRTMMILCNVGSATGALGMVLLLRADVLATWQIYLLVAWITTFDTFLRPAFGATITLLVPREQLGRAAAMAELGPAMGRTLAPFVAGLLVVTIGLEHLLWLDIVSFIFAGVSLLFVDIPDVRKKNVDGGKNEQEAFKAWMGEMTAGWTFLRSAPGLLALLLLLTGFNLFLGVIQISIGPMILSFEAENLGFLQDSEVAFGLVQSVSGAGMLIGGIFLMTWGGPKTRRVDALLLCLFLQGLMIVFIGLRPNTLLISIAAFAVLFVTPIFNGVNRVLWQIKVPPPLQGRVFALRTTLSVASLPIAYLLGGPLGEYVFEPLLLEDGALAGALGPIFGVGSGRGFGLLIAISGLIVSAIALGAATIPRIRRLETDMPDALPPSGPPGGPPQQGKPQGGAPPQDGQKPAGPAGPPPQERPAQAAFDAGPRPKLFGQHLRSGLRTIRRSPAFASSVVLTLALGFGATAAIFTVTASVLFQRLPFEDPQRLTSLSSLRMSDGNLQFMPISYPDYRDWSEGNDSPERAFESMAVYASQSFNLLLEDGESQHVSGEVASASYFDVLGVPPTLGRVYTEEEDREGDARTVAVISHALWRDHFKSSPDVLDETMVLSGLRYQILGVMPDDFRGLTDQSEIWVPLQLSGRLRTPDFLELRRFRWLSGVGRLADGGALTKARAAMDGVSAGMEEAYPETNEDVRLGIRMLLEVWFQNYSLLLLTLSAAAVLLLIIATLNVASLMAGRALARRREIAMRKALGAGQSQLFSQLLVESLLFAVLGGFAGLITGQWLIRLLSNREEVSFYSFVDIGINPYATVAVILLIFLAGLTVGLAPILVVSKTSMVEAMKASDESGGSRRVLQGIIVAEVALALALTVVAGLFIQSLQQIQDIDVGYRYENLMTLRLDVKDPRYDSPERLEAFLQNLEERLSALPGVENVASTSPGMPTDPWLLRDVSIEGNDIDEDNKVLIEVHHVSPTYFDLLEVDPLQGRAFEKYDVVGTEPVVVVDEVLAERYWAGEDPIGKRLRMFYAGPDDPWFRVVGVVPEIAHRGKIPDQLQVPDIYFALLQEPPQPMARLNLMVTTRDDASFAGIGNSITRELNSLAPDLPPYDVSSMEARFDQQLGTSRLIVGLGTLAALLALALASVGVYGVVSYVIQRERREFAIRLALGARRRVLLVRRLSRIAALAAIGIFFGVVTAELMTRALRRFFVGVIDIDVWIFIGPAALLMIIALSAALRPILRAVRVEPASELRGG